MLKMKSISIIFVRIAKFGQLCLLDIHLLIYDSSANVHCYEGVPAFAMNTIFILVRSVKEIPSVSRFNPLTLQKCIADTKLNSKM